MILDQSTCGEPTRPSHPLSRPSHYLTNYLCIDTHAGLIYLSWIVFKKRSKHLVTNLNPPLFCAIMEKPIKLILFGRKVIEEKNCNRIFLTILPDFLLCLLVCQIVSLADAGYYSFLAKMAQNKGDKKI